MNDENPFSNPEQSQRVEQQGYRQGYSKLVPQVRIVAILMIVQAVLEFLIGIYFVVMGFAWPTMMANQPNQMPAEQEFVNKYLFAIFLILGGCAIVIAILRLVAGILGVSYRGRTLGIVSHISGFLMLVTCYCFPTAIGLGIYGCIVYFNSDVAQAFTMRSNGYTSEQVLAHFNR